MEQPDEGSGTIHHQGEAMWIEDVSPGFGWQRCYKSNVYWFFARHQTSMDWRISWMSSEKVRYMDGSICPYNPFTYPYIHPHGHFPYRTWEDVTEAWGKLYHNPEVYMVRAALCG